MSLDPNKTYLVWNGTAFPNSSAAQFKAPAGSRINWGDGTEETFSTASTTKTKHTYTDGKTEHTIVISELTSIGDLWFDTCSNLTSVMIGDNVTSIGNGAFYGCKSLTSVTIGNSVTSIGNIAFSYCSRLTSIIIPDSVTSIDDGAFYFCDNLIQLVLFPETPPTLASDSISNNIQSIYVQQSSQAAYQAAANWAAFADKIVGDNLYLSFVRFNQKNKEYINEKISEFTPSSSVNVVQTTGDSTDKVMSQKAATDNFARLVDGKVPESQLPSYVDDVLEYDSKSDFPATGEEGKIYVDKSTNLTYRWSGSTYIQVGGGDLNIVNGTGIGSLVQKRLRSDGVTWTTAKAYQGASTALGEGTQAGRTEEEFNAYFWDSVNNVPLHGGQGKNSLGEILDYVGLTYTKSYSSAFAANENNKAIPKDSAVFGRYNTAYNLGEFVCGNYTDNNRNPNTVFAVGTGIDDSRRSTGFEVRTDGYCYSYNKAIATEDYVNDTAVRKEGTPYVVYISEANGKSTVMPYRFQKQSIVDAEYKVMFQPMLDGRLYTRYPTDEYHAANKGYVDSKTSLYKHRIHATNTIFDLIVISNSSTKITKFTDLVGANYISMYVGSPACTPAVEVGIISSGSPNYDTIGIKVGWNLDGLNFIQYLDSNLESDTVTEL